MKRTKGFTPLENAADFSRRLSSDKAYGGLKPPSAPLENLFLTGSVQTARPVRNVVSNGVKERSSLTGFTFIELLITLSILAISFIPLMNMYSGLLSQLSFINDLTSARYLAQEGMEKIKNLNLTIAQMKELGDTWEPPLNEPALVIDRETFRTRRRLIPLSDPLEIHIEVFKEKDIQERRSLPKPFVELVTLFEDFEWTPVP